MREGFCKFHNAFFREHLHGKPAICDAGVNVRKLVGGPDEGWVCRTPCSKGSSFHDATKAVSCEKYEEPTEQEIAEHRAEIDKAVSEVLSVAKIVQKAKKSGDKSGVVECPRCADEVQWAASDYNGHVHAKCVSCDFAYME